jgi:hypothetical protein
MERMVGGACPVAETLHKPSYEPSVSPSGAALLRGVGQDWKLSLGRYGVGASDSDYLRLPMEV